MQKAINIEGIELNKNQRFYILGLAPNAARLSVRFYYEDSFGNLLENMQKHYQRMELVKPSWEEREYLGTGAMLYETVNQKSKDKKRFRICRERCSERFYLTAGIRKICTAAL